MKRNLTSARVRWRCRLCKAEDSGVLKGARSVKDEKAVWIVFIGGGMMSSTAYAQQHSELATWFFQRY